MKWITISATEDTREVRCSNCGYKVTYHGDNIPKRCMCCREVPDSRINKLPSREATNLPESLYNKGG